MCFPSIAEYENDKIPKFHLTAEELLWELSIDKHSERETQMKDHQEQKIVPAIAEKVLVFIGIVVLYSLAYDTINVMYVDNFVTALTAKIQKSIALIGTVRKASIEPNVLAK